MWMIIVTLFSALSIAAVAAYFSIIGLTTLFAAAFLPVLIMGSVLEVGKLVATSWVYQTWEYSPKTIRALLSSMIVVLMLITSMGIFGLLSKGYLDAKNPATQQTLEITSLKSDVDLVREKIAAIEEEDGFYRLELADLQAQIDNYPKNYATKRIETYEIQKPRREEISTALEENRELKAEQLKTLRGKNRELNTLETELIELEGDLGPIKYVARLLGVSADDGVQYVILAIIFAFDPLAILLILAANISIKHKYGRKTSIGKIIEDSLEENIPEKPESQIEDFGGPAPPGPAVGSRVETLEDSGGSREGGHEAPRDTRRHVRAQNPNYGRKA
jgi:hypothetical protein